MNDLALLIKALSSLLWPLIAGLLLYRFLPALSELVESAKSRKFTLKVGGQELTMDEASEQQRTLIADLQAQVVEIRKELKYKAEEQKEIPAADTMHYQKSVKPSAILWVDDEPKNNSFFIEELSRLGVRVDTVINSHEGMRKLGRQQYDVVISDMGRSEDGKDNYRAGLDLLERVKSKWPDLPFVIFCSSRGEDSPRNLLDHDSPQCVGVLCA